MNFLKVIITGRPGVGKTTVFMRTIDCLRRVGIKVGGIICPEEREGGVRVGFRVVDLFSGREGWLAPVYSSSPVRVGKYGVHLEEFENIGVGAIHRAVEEADVIAVDEVGPMELKSWKFKEAIERVLSSRKPSILVVHWKLQNSFARQVASRGEVKVVEVTLQNRERLPSELCKLLGG